MTRKLVLALTLGTGLAAAGTVVMTQRGSTAELDRPNFLVVVTDDQTLEAMRALPKTERLVGRKGTTFTEAIVTTPHCCPSRATMLTGQYAHNHGVLSNKHGYPSLRDPDNVLPVWLQEAGYKTAHLGKFLNSYEKAIGSLSEVAPGWDEWHTLLKPRRYLDYELQVNGGSVSFGERRRDYLSRELSERTRRVIRRLARSEKPFYVQLDNYAPHTGPGDPSGKCEDSIGAERREYRRYADEPLPTAKSFNERRIADKPVFLGRRERLSKKKKRQIRDTYRCSLASLRTVDEGMKSLVKGLESEGLDESTVVIFTSDNGYYYGEHRIPGSKTLPYEEGIRVPLMIRLPKSLRGSERVRRVSEQVTNVDLAPTILDLASAQPCADGRCRTMDGRSLVPLLRGGGGFPRDRAAVVELTQAKERVRPTLSCSYRGVRTRRAVYVEHTSIPRPSDRSCRAAEQVEHYDLRSDPAQLENLAARGNGGAQRKLAARLATLGDCAGIAGRDPQPKGRSHCE